MMRAVMLMVPLLVSAAYAAEPPAPVTPPTPPPSLKPRAATSDAATTDRLSLDATTVTGNRELPKVMYIIPWKKAELGQLPGQPFNSLLNEVLQPVDREVFRREVNYYHVVSSHDPVVTAGQTQPTVTTDSK